MLLMPTICLIIVMLAEHMIQLLKSAHVRSSTKDLYTVFCNLSSTGVNERFSF